jgi:hypothetical protein
LAPTGERQEDEQARDEDPRCDMVGKSVHARDQGQPREVIHLVVLTPAGEILIVEFKTGPANTDFRAALAQLLDYGSDMWKLSFDEFEATVPARYFASRHCVDPRVKNKNSVVDAARSFWPDLSDEELSGMSDRVSRQLASGEFNYALVAQRFTPTIERTAEYMNVSMGGSRFYAVELVRFKGEGIESFESRTVLRPPTRGTSTPAQYTNEARFLEGITDEPYRDALQELFEVCRGLGLKVEWGTVGASMRILTPDRVEPLSIGWAYAPDKPGVNGLDLTLGFDPARAKQNPSATAALEHYLEAASRLPGVQPATRHPKLRAWHLKPDVTVAVGKQVAEVLANLAQAVNSGST